MTRRCSHCCNNGHNSRTCPSRGGVKLFGVRLTDGSIKKSASMGNLSSAAHYHSSSSAAASPNPSSPSSDPLRDPAPVEGGYVSDDPVHASCSSNCRGERKKGKDDIFVGTTGTLCKPESFFYPCHLIRIPWTEEEHRMFLVGLQKLGKGDWRGIARNFVVSRTPTQVASHAQKYFIRQGNSTRRKRRSSLFDMAPDMSMDPLPVLEEQFLARSSPAGEIDDKNPLPSLNASLDQECEPMEPNSNNASMDPEEPALCSNFSPMVPALFPTYLTGPFPFWPPNLGPIGEERGETHKVLKPIPVLPKNPAHVDELVGMSKLSLGEAAAGRIEPSELSLKLLGARSRQSAFHANPTAGGSDLSPNSNVIHAL